MELEELRILAAVVEHGTLLEAAQSLGTSRGRVRRKLANLESRCAVPLLKRVDGVLIPTPAGDHIVEGAKRMFADASTLIATVREVAAEPMGRVRLCLPVGFPHVIVGVAGSMLSKRFPKMSMDIRVSENPLAMVPDRADLAICVGESSVVPNFQRSVVWHLRLKLLADRGYLTRHGEPETVEDLSKHALHLWRHPHQPPGDIKLRGGHCLSVSPQSICADEQFLRHLAARGEGIVYVPDPGIPDPAWPNLRPVLADLVGDELELSCYVPTSMTGVPRIEVILDMTRQAFELSSKMGAARAA